ncbi:MAG: DUF885 domain-containing protein [Planctomycetes bacterium]|nr:DUF885 domain-containing protein [Planctomycetota bacterium]MBI3844765.1 DUF885 domain-containing protein [Planctomycetota bacterium]
MRATSIGLVAVVVACVVGCQSGEPVTSDGRSSSSAAASPTPAFREIEERYFVEFLRRNPVVATYLGGDAYRPDLADVAGNLRDYAPAALEKECRFYDAVLADLERLPSRPDVPPAERVDRRVIAAQCRFMLHQVRDRKYPLRSLDTYAIEAFRGVDWHTQGMTDLGGGHYGTEAEWRQVVRRVRALPAYLDTARANLTMGVQQGVVPDFRMIERDGFATCTSNAEYFRKTLPEMATRFLEGQPYARAIRDQLDTAGSQAAEASIAFRTALGAIYYEPGTAVPDDGTAPPRDKLVAAARGDHFAMSEAEYDWALRNNLGLTETAAQLFGYAEGAIHTTEDEMVKVAIEVNGKHNWGIEWGTPEKDRAGVRTVLKKLGEDAPKDDAELLAWYHDTCFRIVAYGREQALFDIPTEYKLDVVETPPVLRSSIDGAAYYPAPPFKKSGVGRFYLTPTGNDAAQLRANNRASVADTAAHEGFPGHDWDYQFSTLHRTSEGKVRWLTPGAVEDSSSMWEDSMRTEGWALYSEALVAEAKPGKPHGYYTPEERLYQLQGQLLRDVRVHVDTGIHTGRLTFDEAADYFAAHVDFFPDARANAATDPDAKASIETAERSMFRYSKWPTQAITYHLGKRAILELRAEVQKIQGATFDLRAFHERVLSSGTIPLAYVRDQILDWAKSKPGAGGN